MTRLLIEWVVGGLCVALGARFGYRSGVNEEQRRWLDLVLTTEPAMLRRIAAQVRKQRKDDGLTE